MSLRFTVLASGSGGNSSLVQVGDRGLLIDIGLGPRILDERLAAAGLSASDIEAVILTHTHSDHWTGPTLTWMRKRKLPLYCHPAHHHVLGTYGEAFNKMQAEGLIRDFEPNRVFAPLSCLRVLPLTISHDSAATFAFRVEGPTDLFGKSPAIGYAADLGTWDGDLVSALAGVDLLALEFNHDVGLERASGRPALLVNRVLGEQGHLSNEQAAEMVRHVLERSNPVRLRHLVQLHLSRECNRPQLARRAVRDLLAEMAPEAKLITATQDHPTPILRLDEAPRRVSRDREPGASPAFVQQMLPGLME